MPVCLQGSLKQLRGHAAALAARQGELVAGQAAACAMVADYLSRWACRGGAGLVKQSGSPA